MMENNLDNTVRAVLNTAEKYVKYGMLDQAWVLLYKYQNEGTGKISAALGNIELLRGNYAEAERLYENAVKQGAGSWHICLNQSVVLEKRGEMVSALEKLKLALDKTITEDEKYFMQNAIAAFYYRNNMLGKAEGQLFQIIKEVPDDYCAHHLRYLVFLKKRQYPEIEAAFQKNYVKFCQIPQYWVDRLDYLEKRECYEEMMDLIHSSDKLMKVIPEYGERKKIEIYIKQGRKESAQKAIWESFLKYGEADVAFCSMILAMTEHNYSKAQKIANVILDSQKDAHNFLYYVTLLIDIFIWYYETKGEKTERVQKLMKEKKEIAVKWFADNGYAIKGLERALQQIGL